MERVSRNRQMPSEDGEPVGVDLIGKWATAPQGPRCALSRNGALRAGLYATERWRGA